MVLLEPPSVETPKGIASPCIETVAAVSVM